VSEKVKTITTPLEDATVAGLCAGDIVRICGVVYTARDAAHKRLVGCLDSGEPLPFELAGQVIYYAGPTPGRPGQALGSAGPTTSYRMDAFAPRLIEAGLKGMIGKGGRSEEVIEAMKKYRAVYFAAVGGAGALIGRTIKTAGIVAYEDLGPEAIRRLVVEGLPAVVANDIYGGDIYKTGYLKYRR
jgi:fumarate hydratase subunit beta